MHLIHSALRDPHETNSQHQPKGHSEIQLRYQAYTEACHKYKQYITDIRKYFPNWMPPFR